MKISIITANFNYSRYLTQLLESIKNQDYENWEHIVVDDGSTDNSVELIESYSNKDSRVRLIKQNNKGQTASLNNAIREITGDIICWINSDDWFCQVAFSKVISTFKENPETEIVYGNAMVYYEDESKIKLRKQLNYDFKLFLYNGFCNCMFSNSVFWKKKKQEETGFMNQDYDYNMDSEFFARLFYNSRIKKINFPIAYFRWHKESKTIKNLGHNASDEYRKEINGALKVSLKLTGLNDNLDTYDFKIKKLYFRLKRIILRLLFGHYFQIKKEFKY